MSSVVLLSQPGDKTDCEKLNFSNACQDIENCCIM